MLFTYIPFFQTQYFIPLQQIHTTISDTLAVPQIQAYFLTG